MKKTQRQIHIKKPLDSIVHWKQLFDWQKIKFRFVINKSVPFCEILSLCQLCENKCITKTMRFFFYINNHKLTSTGNGFVLTHRSKQIRTNHWNVCEINQSEQQRKHVYYKPKLWQCCCLWKYDDYYCLDWCFMQRSAKLFKFFGRKTFVYLQQIQMIHSNWMVGFVERIRSFFVHF